MKQKAFFQIIGPMRTWGEMSSSISYSPQHHSHATHQAEEPVIELLDKRTKL
jgi:hypothetical protein